jgi:endonuclease YncB( thermonuclease family)
MKRIVHGSFVVAALIWAAPPLRAAPYIFQNATVVRCHDGDTCVFNLHDQHPVFGRVTWRGRSVRVAGIDAPEIDRGARCPAEQALAVKARDRLLAILAAAQEVSIEVVTARDQYGRMVGRLLADGQDAGAMLVAEGLARTYKGGRRKGWC